ncbi:MAG: transketolase [Alphaproteobacteria bacterium]|nr:transketolase [Alphaproteobacteria bacterium]
MSTPSNLTAMANAIRALSMDAVEAANSGHPGMPMGMADVATVLFSNHLKFSANNPDWPDRDRFILSAGHGSMLLYSLLHLTGYKDISLEEIKNFRQLGSKTAGHPEFGHAKGIETTTGPLGQGFANAVGFAMAERHLNAEFGDTLVDHMSYVIAGDGCLMEGISHEAASFAGHLKLGKLIVLFDDNGISIDGSTDITTSDDITQRFLSYGWQVLECDGHNHQQIDNALSEAKLDSTKPSIIRCKTQIGFGSPNRGGTAKIHGAPLGNEEMILTRKTLNWPHEPFMIPEDILSDWRIVGTKCDPQYSEWQQNAKADDIGAAFSKRLENTYEAEIKKAISEFKQELNANPQKIATRVASQNAIEVLLTVYPSLFGGSADLTGSNNTKVSEHTIFSASDYKGRYIHYGVREHAMAAAMNGLALHGGITPFGGTFLVFTDYCRPAIRLSALMQQKVIYVMTHDSIGLGEDGPTHQPVEHLAALRVIPNLDIFRPCDIVETAEAWELACLSESTPSILALSRQGLPQLRLDYKADNLSAKGGYILREASTSPKITLMASGSEVMLAEEARSQLEEKGIATRLVSVPCLDRLLQQGNDYIEHLHGGASAVIAIEAGLETGWSHAIGANGFFIGMSNFGASAPAAELYQHFGITTKAIIDLAQNQLKHA